MARQIRVTHRTDTRGTVNSDFRGLFEVGALKAAYDAGIPSEMLDPAGWNGDENDLRGYFAEHIYLLGEIHWTAPDAIEQITTLINAMQGLCRSLEVDPKAAIPYEMARFYRSLIEGRERRNAVARGDELPLASLEDAGITWPVEW